MKRRGNGPVFGRYRGTGKCHLTGVGVLAQTVGGRDESNRHSELKVRVTDVLTASQLAFVIVVRSGPAVLNWMFWVPPVGGR